MPTYDQWGTEISPSDPPPPPSPTGNISSGSTQIGTSGDAGVISTYTDEQGNVHVVEDYSGQGGGKYDTVVSGFKGGYSGSGFESMGAGVLASSNIQGYEGKPGSAGAGATVPSKVGLIEKSPELQKAVAGHLDRGTLVVEDKYGKHITGQRYLDIMQQNRQLERNIQESEYNDREIRTIQLRDELKER